MNQALITSTGQWSLAVLRVSQTRARLWVGTLFPTLKMPERARIDLFDAAGQAVDSHPIAKTDWRRPFRRLRQRFYTTAEFDGLEPGQHYRVSFSRHLPAAHGRAPEWQRLRRGRFDTLPVSLPRDGRQPFTIGLASCFYNHRDGGQAAGAYRALYERGDATVRPAVTFLTGDQVYLDIGFDSLSLIPGEIRQRIAGDYALHWQALGSLLSRGATWMLPDDHEYWNDYPFHDSLLPTLLALKLDPVRKTWEACARDGVRRVQQSPRVERFTLGEELAFCLADLRSHRQEHTFLPAPEFDRLLDWARGLHCPGVLAIPQPLIVNRNPSERNLLSFPAQYRALVEALGSSGHDVVVLSGDVHFGRIASAPLGPNGGRLIEVIASPLSNLTGLNGLATATPVFRPSHFPIPAVRPAGWAPAPVHYDPTFAVSTRPGRLLSAYPKDRYRSREHFMTLGFHREDDGVALRVNAWRVRERDGDNLPVRDFDEYRTTLS